ncbi:ATP synthase F1 subunit delta [Desulfomicrobium baculatum]|uniref:ATP synthase subunit delta n=1 Tax=Desulfomicrobium baculatum (strain DSM 4028 / VKM B-1378 / X) TaxID=525897 RepID=C7LPV3_DESBD|nr:ATP synthase F1 subunit delta [Desulfomicrobium baculatum]ACU91435.1 ATP synthase F1, delta subunit [Desulfomicrobium baculatum DSM 4028]
MTGNIVARRYAKALFAVAQAQSDKGSMAQYGADLARLAGLLENAPELTKIFRNPIFGVEEKRGVINKILEKVAPCAMVRNFCLLLADKNRLSFLPEINASYGTLLDSAQGVLRGKLVTAVKLSDVVQKNVVDKLQKESGQTVVLDYEVDQEIIGGLMLKIGDKILDASIRAQLQILKENIKRGE